jgi:putative phosphoribosyl transferase
MRNSDAVRDAAQACGIRGVPRVNARRDDSGSGLLSVWRRCTLVLGPGMKEQQSVTISVQGVNLEGDLTVPKDARGLTLFAHGSGSSRRSPRNQYVARVLQKAGVATLLFDLLTSREEQEEYFTRHLRFDIGMLAGRLAEAARWVAGRKDVAHLDLAFFGASTGAAAALIAASKLGEQVKAVVSRGGRPDLAGDALPEVHAATLLIVGGEDHVVIDLNRNAFARLTCEKQMKIIPGATHLFEEPGALEEVAKLAADWFHSHFQLAHHSL